MFPPTMNSNNFRRSGYVGPVRGMPAFHRLIGGPGSGRVFRIARRSKIKGQKFVVGPSSRRIDDSINALMLRVFRDTGMNAAATGVPDVSVHGSLDGRIDKAVMKCR